MKIIQLITTAILWMTTWAAFSQEVPPNPPVDHGKNWVSSASYDLNGTTLSKSISYSNTLGNGTQSQSWDLLTNKVWASMTLYDRHGRGALQTLTAPVGTQFGFSNNLILDSSGGSYTHADFEGAYVDNPKTVHIINSKLGRYYFNNQDDAYMDNTRYPYSRTVYSKLNPGSVKKLLGGNKVQGNWLQVYSFSMPATQELALPNAFNNSDYDSRDITKTISRDVNGVEAVVFTDADGNTLAAARSGNEDGNPVKHNVVAVIKEQGFVDIHVPKGCEGVLLISNSYGIPLRIYDLITETQLPYSSGNYAVPAGFYRVAVANSDTYEYNENTPIKITHQVNYYDYTLNNYDKAGRLLTGSQSIGTDVISTYRYNSLNQLLATSSPDEGSTQFKYRKDGQIRFSQSSKQAAVNEVSFTDYDELGRPIKSGVGTADFAGLNPDNSDITSGLKEILSTLYDIPDSELAGKLTSCGLSPGDYRQTFLYGNVSRSATSRPETTITWFSYDIYGRVQWMIQEIPGTGCLKTIDYTYDAITGMVVQVDYQKNSPGERFVHRYDYNEGARLTKVSTSADGVNFVTNAAYAYTETGALKRTEIAEDLQGIDYVYNLNGQLKAINSPQNTGFKDPGNDSPATNGFKPDVFSMILDYHEGDYSRTATHLLGLQNAATNNQLNGNIGGIRWANNTPVASGGIDTYQYRYNKNNWLAAAQYGKSAIASGNVSFAPNMNRDYEVSNITYDANGNIQTLKRNGVTNAGGSNDMDDFSYEYEDGNNQLLFIEDGNDNANPNRYNDLRDQSGSGQDNYVYNSIGQLVTNVQDEVHYEYYTSGLVSKISTFSSVNTGSWATTYREDYANATHADAQLWTVTSGGANVTGGTYMMEPSPASCDVLDGRYGRSLRISSKVISSSATPISASRKYQVQPNMRHQLSLDVIAKQLIHTHHVDNEIAIGNNLVPAINNLIGYSIRVRSTTGTLLATASFNTPNPTAIADADLESNAFLDVCDLYYDEHNVLEFTPTTEEIVLEIRLDHDATKRTAIFLDNITIAVAATPRLSFFYNDKGQRVRKDSYQESTGQTHTTFYVRDASGNVLGLYEKNGNEALRLAEQTVYGAGRVGVFYRNNSLPDGGTYAYQLTDHLGNVRAVVTKSGGIAMAITNKTDYYPFGMPMPDRNVEGDYRYKFQGQERDNETGKEAFELRLWDSRIGRWLTTDPYRQFQSPYLGMGNDPINGIDPDGGLFGRIRALAYQFLHGGEIYQNDNGKWYWTSGTYQEDADGFTEVDLINDKDFGYGGLGKLTFEPHTANILSNLDVGLQHVNDAGVSGQAVKLLTANILTTDINLMTGTASLDYFGKNGEVKGKLLSISQESGYIDIKGGYDYVAKDWITYGGVYGRSTASTPVIIAPLRSSAKGKIGLGSPFLEAKIETNTKDNSIKIHFGLQEEWSKSYGRYLAISASAGFNFQGVINWKL